jgi:alkylated DNA repair dioxygenase AlkB
MARPLSAGWTDLGDGAWVDYRPGFVADHASVMARLLESLPLRVEPIRIFGRFVDTPRRTSWHGDPDAVYSYSGRTFSPLDWTEALTRLRTRLRDELDQDFNAVLVNHYRDGTDSMGWHADDEPELGPRREDIRVASISVGAPRRFVLRERAQPRSKLEVSLGEGDLLVMGGTSQRHWQHSVPKTARPVGERINLTFRVVTAPG